MFRIREIVLYKGIEKKPYYFSDNAYVYGHNGAGKTALTKIIDYILGSSEPLSHDGLDNIEEISAYIQNDKTDLWIKRNIVTGDYYYKRTKNSKYTLVSAENYKETICEVITGTIDTKAIKVYKKVFEENPTFRSFSFLNFIDEIGQGDLGAVFTRGKDIKHLVRIRNIMDFFFNYENIENIYEKRIRLEELENEQKKLNNIKNQYVNSVIQIRNLFVLLGLDCSDDMSKNYETYINFQSNFYREKPKPTGDLVYLTRASHSLSEELKIYSYLKEQSDKAESRKKRTKSLLSILDSIIAENEKYNDDVDIIKKTIKEIQQDRLILSLADYDASIEKIKDEKEKIDRKIEILKSQSTELGYEQTIRILALLDNNFNVISSTIDIARIGYVEEEIKQTRKAIKELKNSYSQKGIKDFNNCLNKMYLHSEVQNVGYLDEDRKYESFSLEFDPFSQTVIARHKDGDAIISYMPGSMARHNHIQMLVYLCMFDYLYKNFRDFIYLPVLIIDSADQSMEDNSFDEIYPSLIKMAQSIGIQTIFISKHLPTYIKQEDLTDISGGLNPFHLRRGD